MLAVAHLMLDCAIARSDLGAMRVRGVLVALFCLVGLVVVTREETEVPGWTHRSHRLREQ